MSRHTYETTLSFGSDGSPDFTEVDVTVAFDVSWGRPSSFLGPAEDAEVSDITLVQVGDRFRPWGFHHWSDGHFAALAVEALFASETHLERMLEIACEEEAGIEDAIQERRWEDRREGAVA